MNHQCVLIFLLIYSFVLQTSSVVILRTPDFATHEYISREATFGREISEHGLWGNIFHVKPADACENLEPAPSPYNSTRWIALISRYNCTFVEKVLHAQQAGYGGAIVYNVNSDRVINMGKSEGSESVKISSVFIGHHNAKHLMRYSGFINATVGLLGDKVPDTIEFFLLPFAIVCGVCTFVVSAIVIARCTVERLRRRRRRLPPSKLKRLPIKKYSKKDSEEEDVCAVCLEIFVNGDKLRVLPCDHEYHQKCIDPWLTRNSRTCPLCKRRVFSSEDSESDAEESAGGGNTDDSTVSVNTDERTPLLAAAPSRSRRHEHGAAATSVQRARSQRERRNPLPTSEQQQLVAEVHASSSHEAQVVESHPTTAAVGTTAAEARTAAVAAAAEATSAAASAQPRRSRSGLRHLRNEEGAVGGELPQPSSSKSAVSGSRKKKDKKSKRLSDSVTGCENKGADITKDVGIDSGACSSDTGVVCDVSDNVVSSDCVDGVTTVFGTSSSSRGGETNVHNDVVGDHVNC